jgi:hypothetical protein
MQAVPITIAIVVTVSTPDQTEDRNDITIEETGIETGKETETAGLVEIDQETEEIETEIETGIVIVVDVTAATKVEMTISDLADEAEVRDRVADTAVAAKARLFRFT